MFWKPKDRKEPTLSKEAQSKKANSEVASIEEDLAQQLQSYYLKRKEQLVVPEDTSLEEAKAKVLKATKFLNDSGLEVAVGSIIPDHVRHWGGWSKRDDFFDYVGFEAQNLKVRADDKKLYVNFTYKNSNYALELTGLSYNDYSGSLIFLNDNEPVLEVELFSTEKNDVFKYSFRNLNKLTVGDWMQDVLSISAEIQAHELERLRKFESKMSFWKNPDKIKKAARNIQLEDDEK